jgi:hypothetical protein
MRADALAALLVVMRGDPVAEAHVTPATPVTLQPGYRSKALEVQALQPLQVKTGKEGKGDFSPVTASVTAFLEADADAIEERAGLAADAVPDVYLDAWARTNCQKPFRASEGEWRLALDDGGRFLDAWGAEAAALGWTPGELFDVTAGLVWRLCGERVVAVAADHVRLSDGRMIRRSGQGVRYD